MRERSCRRTCFEKINKFVLVLALKLETHFIIIGWFWNAGNTHWGGVTLKHFLTASLTSEMARSLCQILFCLFKRQLPMGWGLIIFQGNEGFDSIHFSHDLYGTNSQQSTNLLFRVQKTPSYCELFTVSLRYLWSSELWVLVDFLLFVSGTGIGTHVSKSFC